jgi:hypothetical protein
LIENHGYFCSDYQKGSSFMFYRLTGDAEIYKPNESFFSIFPAVIKKPGFVRERLEGIIADRIYDHISIVEEKTEAIFPISMFKLSKSLERNDALTIVSSVACLGAIEIESLRTIVFLAEPGCLFYLTYGAPCNAGRIYDCTVRFDVEHGFLMAVNSMTEQEICILKEMQRYFVAWKARDYEGDLFPSALAIRETAAVAGAAMASAGDHDGRDKGWAKEHIFLDSDSDSDDENPIKFSVYKGVPGANIKCYNSHGITTRGGFPSFMEEIKTIQSPKPKTPVAAIADKKYPVDSRSADLLRIKALTALEEIIKNHDVGERLVLLRYRPSVMRILSLIEPFPSIDEDISRPFVVPKDKNADRILTYLHQKNSAGLAAGSPFIFPSKPFGSFEHILFNPFSLMCMFTALVELTRYLDYCVYSNGDNKYKNCSDLAQNVLSSFGNLAAILLFLYLLCIFVTRLDMSETSVIRRNQKDLKAILSDPTIHKVSNSESRVVLNALFQIPKTAPDPRVNSKTPAPAP